MTRGLAAALLASVVAAAGAAARPPSQLLVRTPGRALGPTALTSRYLVWESGPINAENVPTLLHQRDLRNGSTQTLARSVDLRGGVASTSQWVAYVSDQPMPVLIAVRRDGRQRHVVGRNLITAIAGRGERVAWAEQDGNRQRVFVLNLRTRHRWLAADLARCVGADCYRIDYLTLAERGVIFTRGAIGPQPSFVLRRSFGGPLERVRLPNDAQPDLVPSSAGALYYHYAHGWYRWDLDRRRPAPTRYRGSRPAPLLAYEQGSWYLKTGQSCRPNVVRVDPAGRIHAVILGSAVKQATRVPGSDCATLSNLEIAGSHVVTSWALMPAYAIGAHIDFDLVGAVMSS